MRRHGPGLVSKRLAHLRDNYWYFTAGLHEELKNQLSCPTGSELEKIEKRRRSDAALAESPPFTPPGRTDAELSFLELVRSDKLVHPAD
jgi:hypothetical protein